MTEENEITKLKEENIALSWELANQAQIAVSWEDKYNELRAENERLKKMKTHGVSAKHLIEDGKLVSRIEKLEKERNERWFPLLGAFVEWEEGNKRDPTMADHSTCKRSECQLAEVHYHMDRCQEIREREVSDDD